MAVRQIFLNRVQALSTWGHIFGVLTGVGIQEGDLSSASRRRRGREKPRRSLYSTVPQPDTGGRVEDTQVFERTLVKELGKMAP